MKFIIEDKVFKAETESIGMMRRLIDIIDNQPVPFKESVVKENFTTEIPDDTYLTITADDITCGGKSVTKYNGKNIWDYGECIKCVRKANDLFKTEYNTELLELHVVQTNNIFDTPMPDAKGTFAWLRCVFKVNGKRKVSRWVFRHAYGSVADCGSGCAGDCGYYVCHNASFRGSVFGSVGN